MEEDKSFEDSVDLDQQVHTVHKQVTENLSTVIFKERSKDCPSRIKGTNACKLVDRFCDSKVCPFMHWS